MVDAPAQGESEVQEEPEIQGEPTVSAPTDQFQEGLVEDTSDDDDVEPTVGSGGRGRGVTHGVPSLTRKAHHGSRKKRIRVHLEPVIARLNAHGDILCSLQSDVSSIFISHSTGAKEIGAVKTEFQEMRNELGSLKKLVTNLSDFVRVQLLAPAPPAPTQSMPEEVGPSGPSVTEFGPPGPSLEESGPSGPCVVEDISAGPTGPSVQMESVAGPTGPQVSVDEVVVPPGPSESPNLQTPAPSSPPTFFTAPLAPVTFKKPLSKHISSPTPFPTATSSSPPPSSSIPHPTSEAPPASSSSVGPSSVGPSSAGPSTQPPPTSSFGSFHLPTPPSFITIILQAASVIPHSVHDIKDEFEEAILCTVLAVSAHIHRTDSQPSSSHASKKRKTSSALAEQAKILSTAESKTKDQWARANKLLYIKIEVARFNIFPLSDHLLTLSEWFVCQHRDSWGPFIQKEIKFIRQFQMYQDYCFVNCLPEVQLGQFRAAIAQLRTENPINTPLQVDFATLRMPKIAFLLKLHFLFMEFEVGPIIFEKFARVMARIFVQRGTPLAFHRFIFREYQRGFIKSSVLAPILSESERFVNSDWCKAYPEAALQLENLNSSLYKSNQLILSPEKFMDLNSINLVSDPYSTWVERYNASTIWTPTLIPASSDVDANFSGMHALQSRKFRKQATPTIGELSPTV
ncbi:hypothetical protein Taro_022126 [Colocasia esculenta]|uniref:Uncharacterized protein n=1 Tax=Colocasia esculenta TaxID=4460 RepID=A0A843V0V2_COLES|nr:hypothetical protein [Colocasia esculenta]